MPTAASVMDTSAGLLNDTAKSSFTYAVQIPYLNIALQELQELYEVNNAPLTNKKDDSVIVPVGSFSLGPGYIPLPADLVEIQSISERLNGSNEDYQGMTRVDFLPPFTQILESLVYWTYQGQLVQFIGATTDRQLRINYVARYTIPVTSQNDSIDITNSDTFLAYRTAALCAQFIGENDTRAESLNMMAQMAMDRLLMLTTKGKQAIFTRRRPFMANYKVRGGM